jgi:hypothetical protein
MRTKNKEQAKTRRKDWQKGMVKKKQETRKAQERNKEVKRRERFIYNNNKKDNI